MQFNGQPTAQVRRNSFLAEGMSEALTRALLLSHSPCAPSTEQSRVWLQRRVPRFPEPEEPAAHARAGGPLEHVRLLSSRFQRGNSILISDVSDSEVKKLPHWSQPTHIMSLLSYIENGSVKMFWISGTKCVPCSPVIHSESAS